MHQNGTHQNALSQEGKNAEVTLRPITAENIRAILRLEVAPEQRQFVASNLVTMAFTYVDPYVPWAIYAGQEVVGLVAIEMIPDNPIEDRYWICRFMIGEAFQGKGYGTAAMREAMAMIAAKPDADRVRLSVVPENTHAIRFYERLGFVDIGEELQGEAVMEHVFSR